MSKYKAFLPENLNAYLSVYWGYYQHLETEYLSIFQSNSEDKYKAVSLYLSIGSEIDVMFKVLILIINDNYAGNSIDLHRAEYAKWVDDLGSYDISVKPLNGRRFSPWSNTSWWSTYNKIKHQRTLKNPNGDLFFFCATQNNIQKALGALYILEKNYIDIIREAVDDDYPEFSNCKSKLFE